ncbi:hypothetical protein [Haloechinothrix alba]|uniref:hypothetical protein n=1 Tax=Haloechinothrix alba TaxID=664784 RepID=UPI000B782E38|nr:hypothetical protein [Haloechinothrix alba]
MAAVTLMRMEVTEQDIARIPRGNVRVPVAEFVEVWRAGERRNEEQTARGVRDWYAAGVIMTCRWMATATVRPNDGRRWYPARAPVTSRTRGAYEELIEAEFLAAEKLAMKQPRPAWLAKRVGWIEAVCATLRWAWRRSGPAPLELDAAPER